MPSIDEIAEPLSYLFLALLVPAIVAFLRAWSSTGWSSNWTSLALALNIAALGASTYHVLRSKLDEPTQAAPPNDPVSRALAKLPKGSAIAIAPSSVKQYEDFDIALILAQANLIQLVDRSQSSLPGNFVVKGIPEVRISSRMRAELVGEDFIIDDRSPKEQAVAFNADTTWKWRVRSEWPGTRTMKLRLHTIVSLGEKEAPRTIEVAEASIAVKVNPTQWAMRNWQWLAGAVVLPFLAWLGLRILDRSSRP